MYRLPVERSPSPLIEPSLPVSVHANGVKQFVIFLPVHFEIKAGVKNGLADSRHSCFSSSSLRVANGIVALPRQVFASLSPLWLSIKSQRKGSTFLPFLEHALSDISKVRLLFNVGADFGRGV